MADLDDVERRLLRNLVGDRREEIGTLKAEVILVAHDLAPSQTASLDTERVKGIAIDGGGPTGHTAIIAQMEGLMVLAKAHRDPELLVGLGDLARALLPSPSTPRAGA